ncbi:hypothetical protein PYR71_08955 [Rhizobium sp. MC63]|uniref:Uncharacterized protein n=1 Tax=Rhizobium mulingense TaxID=3031128 RepID=A0ACC6MU70_9HYPH|nr:MULTISPECIES: hypothetical protein [unclassified Rhizobium]MDF0696637.1 hypothetical protein [Rhizobium sp. MC63]MEA3516301.1 hypothetical protein [Rhizobium sp. MJ31]
MLRALLNTRMQVCLKAIFLLAAIGLKPAAATPPCPPRNELLAKATVVVEERVKSLSIGESRLLPTDPNDSTRMIRIDLEMELATMALITGLGGDDTFEWELSRNELGPGLELYSMNNCSYHKFPDDLFSR